MNKKFFSIFLLTLFCGCDRDPLLFRTGADYMPLEIGNTWIYLQEPNDTLIVKVTGNKLILTREAWIVEYNGNPEYWWKDNRRLDKFYCESIMINGEEVEVAKIWIPWLHLPLLLGESWEYKFKEESQILGETVVVKTQTIGRVKELKNNNYTVEITLIKSKESKSFGSFCDTLIYHEIYGPNIGIIKRTTSNSTETLISYTIK